MRIEKIFIAALFIASCAAAVRAAPAMIILSSATYSSFDSLGAPVDNLAYALATDADNNVFLTGTSGSDFLSQEYSKTLALSPSAQGLFHNGNLSNNSKGIALDGLGNIIVVGEENNGANLDFLTLKYSQNFAALLSSAVFDSGDYDSAAAVKTDGQNNIFVTGYTTNAGNINVYTIKYDQALSQLSTAAYDSGNTDQGSAIAIDHSGNVIVAGFTQVGSSNHFLLIKYDSDLHKLLPEVIYNSGTDEAATGVAVDSRDNIIVTGRQGVGAAQNFCTLKYNSFLELVSSAVYDSGGTDIPTGVAVDSNDNIIVTGQTGLGPAANYFTIKYDKYFNIISTAAYNGGFSDIANAVAADADDNVIVTGQSATPTYNYFTIKYSASPKITAVSPVYIGETAYVTLTGKGFLADSAVSFQDANISTGAASLGSGQLTMSVTPSTSVVLGVTTVTVTNSNGESFTSYSLAYTRLRKTVPASSSDTIKAIMKLGPVAVDIPSGSFPQQEIVTLYPVPAAAGDIQQVGEALYLAGTPSTSSLVNLSITLRYSAADLGTYPAASLSLAYYDATTGWVTLPSTVDTSARSVTAVGKAASNKYAVIKAVPSGGGGGGGTGGNGGSGIPATVYPNPYRPGSGGSFDQSTLGDGVVFAGLDANSTFKLTIVDIAAQLVFQKSAAADSAGRYLWDTKTSSGGKAASGVYLYTITGGGSPRKGKFSIIR